MALSAWSPGSEGGCRHETAGPKTLLSKPTNSRLSYVFENRCADERRIFGIPPPISVSVQPALLQHVRQVDHPNLNTDAAAHAHALEIQQCIEDELYFMSLSSRTESGRVHD
jgi:hypothetical protein